MVVEVTQNWEGVPGFDLYTFTSNSGFLRAKVSNYGATLIALELKDAADGQYYPVTLGWGSVKKWQTDPNYFGTVVGRYSDRIKHGKFDLNGKTYQLEINNGSHSLHGGVNSYDKQYWDAEVVANETVRGVKFSLTSPDGDHGYPGALKVTTYVLLDRHDELLFRHEAALLDAGATKTVVNLTNHSYWNLGQWTKTQRDVLGHSLTLNADRVMETDADSIPTGRLLPVTGDFECFDFRAPRLLKKSVEADVMKPARGYDHYLVFARPDFAGVPRHPAPMAGSWAAATPAQGELYCPDTGYGFALHTSEPGVQVYCANYLEPNSEGYGRAAMKHRGGLCLETQGFPDAPNQPHFPSTVLAAGERYEHTTVHKFFIRPAHEGSKL
eukprot:TRINITY_DN4934_c0_g1_i5.p1 TRINITY_DN4934_c0_g1~~TRINITY_DN4934_c0_g1_i5.p1  ORF type:complete len:383 (+),score=84.74 TRINITY_DN4934_c0_g1_i5:236-1384(+)